MPLIHIVADGDHLSSIAKRYGFENFETIWNAPDNAQLRKHRENPSTLLPGDEVLIPQKEEPVFKKPASQSHKFTIHVPQLVLRLKVLDFFGKKIANTDATLEVDGASQPVTTDGAGMLEVPISRDARSAKLKIEDLEFDLQIGALDPLPEDTGIEARLTNLGYPTGDPDEDTVAHDEQVKFAIELFQSDQSLPIDGEMTPDLLDKLGQVHGC